MRRCTVFVVCFCLCAVLMSGCGGAKVPEEVRESSIAVSSKGQISVWFVEDFDKEYYSLIELSEMAAQEATEFNRGGKSSVTVEKVELLPDDRETAVVCYRFDGWESYSEFNEENLFYGTVEEAERQGYSVNVILKSLADGTPLAGEGLKQMAGRKLIITDTRASIYCPGKVTHVSAGVLVNEDGSINTREASGPAYILLK